MLPKDEFDLSKLRILLADDHSIVREQLSIRLKSEPDLDVVETVATSQETFKKIQTTHPHLLLIDPLMRDGLGLATLRQVRTNFPELVIVVLTAYVDTALNLQFKQMGIQKILTKGMPSSELIAELRASYASARFPDRSEP